MWIFGCDSLEKKSFGSIYQVCFFLFCFSSVFEHFLKNLHLPLISQGHPPKEPCWNGRGLARPYAKRALCYLVRRNKSDVVWLMESKLSADVCLSRCNNFWVLNMFLFYLWLIVMVVIACFRMVN